MDHQKLKKAGAVLETVSGAALLGFGAFPLAAAIVNPEYNTGVQALEYLAGTITTGALLFADGVRRVGKYFRKTEPIGTSYYKDI